MKIRYSSQFKKDCKAIKKRGMSGLVDAIRIFESVSTRAFLFAYPDFYQDFTDLYEKPVSHIQEFSQSKRSEGLLVDFEKSDNAMLFVYGTLMKDRSNHDAYLKGSRFFAKGRLKDYALYNLGSYPAIKKVDGSNVLGEIYIINNETLEKINYLESEGSLYRLNKLDINLDEDNKVKAYAYENLKEVHKMVHSITSKD